MPGQGRDISSSSSPGPSPKNAKRAPIRIQPTGYRRPSQSSVPHSSSNPTSPTPKSPHTRSPTPKSPTSYNYTPRLPASPGPSGPASPPAQRPRLSSRTKSAPLVARTLDHGADLGAETATSGLGLAVVTPGETSGQPRIEEDVCPGPDGRTPGDENEDGQGSDDEANARPTTAIPSEQQTRPSPANTLDSQIQGFSTPPTSPRQPKSPKSPQTVSPSQPSQPTSMPEINIGVLGAAQVGKSTFMQRALDLKNPPSPTAPVSARKMSVDGHVYVVRLFELGFDQVEFGGNEEDENIVWPEKLGDLVVPRIDGALTLYDVTNQKSLAEVPGVLNAINKASLPCVLVSCKCDNTPSERQVDPAKVEQRAKTFMKDITAVQTARSSPLTQKQCMSVILRAIISRPASSHELNSTRRRAMSNAVRAVSPRPPDRSGHTRAASEHSGRMLMAKSKEGDNTHAEGSNTPNNEQNEVRDPQDVQGFNPEAMRTLPPQLATRQDGSASKESYTFDQLVDRLLAQPHSKADAKFISTFLAFYRKFAAPGTLLEAIISRFAAMQNSEQPEFTKTTAQLRYLTVLEQWIAQSPEDFLHSWTRQFLLRFIQKVAQDRIFTMAAKEIRARLDSPIDEDDSEGWPFNDVDRPIPDSVDLTSVLTRLDSAGSTSAKDSQKHQHDVSTSTLTPTSSSTSTASNSSNAKLSSVAHAREVSRALIPTSRNPLSKVQWHALMAQSDECIAKELTRMDWILLSAIRPRDAIRHSSISPEQRNAITAAVNQSTDGTHRRDKEKVTGLIVIDRHIAHFNFLADWIKNMVLLRDKPKHRGLMIEKLMRVARKLRELNNYCSMGALLAGLGCSQVQRLVASRDLVPEVVRKDFMKLEILMSSQRSYFGYRLAWDNSPGEKIPYLPVIRRDLLGAETGSKTFLDGDNQGEAFGPGKPGRLNWRKFEVMGDIVAGMQRAQSVPFQKLQKNEEVRSLVVDTRISRDEDELHDRSVQVEPTPHAGDRNLISRLRRR